MPTKFGHSWLLRGDWNNAKVFYEQYIGGEKDPAEAKKMLEKDWDELEAAGVTKRDRHPSIEQLSSLLEAFTVTGETSEGIFQLNWHFFTLGRQLSNQ
ncbi:MAG: hypothetical protein ABIQ93_11855 [Saprospiraceae bacterium]